MGFRGGCSQPRSPDLPPLHPLQIQWGISAWEQVKLTTISGCWAKGFDISTYSLIPAVNSFTESSDLVEDIQAAAKAVGIQDMDINNFINIRKPETISKSIFCGCGT